MAVLSKHGTTARDVSAYLSRAGARAHVAVEPTRIQPDVDAVVFFPDDFARSDAHRVWRDLVSRLSRAALVVVTEDAGTYAAVGPRVAVLGRPAWGWMLIDAMRSCWSEIAEETP